MSGCNFTGGTVYEYERPMDCDNCELDELERLDKVLEQPSSQPQELQDMFVFSEISPDPRSYFMEAQILKTCLHDYPDYPINKLV